MNQDRRTERTEVPGDALALFLRAALARHALDAVSVVDEGGELVAGEAREGSNLDLAWVGAVGWVWAVGASRGAELESVARRATAGRGLDARAIVLRGERLCVTTVGSAGTLRSRVLADQPSAGTLRSRVLADQPSAGTLRSRVLADQPSAGTLRSSTASVPSWEGLVAGIERIFAAALPAVA